MRKRKQQPKNNTRNKRKTARHAQEPEVTAERQLSSSRRRRTNTTLGLRNSPGASSSVVALENTDMSTTRTNFCLVLNVTVLPHDRETAPSTANDASAEDETNTFAVHFVGTFLNTALLFRPSTPGNRSASAEYASAIRDLVMNIFDMLNENIKGAQKVISPDDLAKMPTVRCRNAGEGKCSICLCEFGKKEKVRLLKCLHRFHCACVDPWLLESSDTCPMCRAPLV